MNLWLADDVSARTSDALLEELPRYVAGGLVVVVGARIPQELREQYLADTFGSVDWLWSGADEMRFSRDGGSLVGAVFQVPEQGAELARWWDRCRDRPVGEGALSAPLGRNFDLLPADVRWVSPSGDVLVCLRSQASTESTAVVRLRISRDFDLLFIDGHLAGWLLEQPATYLVGEAVDVPADVTDGHGLGRLLSKYLSLVSLPKVEMIQDGDEGALEEVDELEREITTNELVVPQKEVLLQALRELVED